MSEELETTKVKVFKLDVMIVDHGECGFDEIKIVLENQRYPNWCISPSVMGFEVREVDWHDEHPLNITKQTATAYKELFK